MTNSFQDAFIYRRIAITVFIYYNNCTELLEGMKEKTNMSIEFIQEVCLSYGMIRYFYSDRCLNDENLKEFNQWKITANELVTFDSGLMEMEEIEKPEAVDIERDKQILAVIIRPEIEMNDRLEVVGFEFCGYDLVDTFCYISAITNCGAGFENAIDYAALNRYGLIPSYRQAVNMQLDLDDKYEDSHAHCEIVEIWRKLSE